MAVHQLEEKDILRPRSGLDVFNSYVPKGKGEKINLYFLDLEDFQNVFASF